MGEVVAKKGIKNVVTITWKYAAGDESVGGFKEGFREGRRQGHEGIEPAVPGRRVPGPADRNRGGQARCGLHLLRRRAGAVKFVKDYAAAGLKKQAFRSTALASSPTARWKRRAPTPTASSPRMHYADSLTNARDKAFRLGYAKTYKLQPDVFAVQGYDAAQMLAVGLVAVKGDLSARRPSSPPRSKRPGSTARAAPFTLSKAHNPVQDIYLRQVVGKENKVDQHCQQGPGRPRARLQDVRWGLQARLRSLPPERAVRRLQPGGAGSAAGSLVHADGLRHLPHPMPERACSTGCCCSWWRRG